MTTDVGVTACFVEYRPIPGASLYLLGSDETVWTCSIRGARKGCRGPWRPMKPTPRGRWGTSVRLYYDDGHNTTRTLAALMREVFPPVDADELGRPDPRGGRDDEPAGPPPEMPDARGWWLRPPRPARPKRRSPNPIHVHRSLRVQPRDLVPLEQLEMPRRPMDGISPGDRAAR